MSTYVESEAEEGYKFDSFQTFKNHNEQIKSSGLSMKR